MRILRSTILVLLTISCSAVYGASSITQEEVETAFIYHFLSYTHWEDDLRNYNVCIPEDQGLRNIADKILRNKQVNGRTISIVPKAGSCHVLISNVPSNNKNTLTIGLLSSGALMEFRIVDNKLKFAVDLEKLKNSNLKISSQLLKLAILEEKP
ncbi:MAG: YfiR family protein [Candidatus Omnitrophica bacterium]|nr:YfiR family protein [Candidatus Omnitrophota bacterium]